MHSKVCPKVKILSLLKIISKCICIQIVLFLALWAVAAMATPVPADEKLTAPADAPDQDAQNQFLYSYGYPGYGYHYAGYPYYSGYPALKAVAGENLVVVIFKSHLNNYSFSFFSSGSLCCSSRQSRGARSSSHFLHTHSVLRIWLFLWLPIRLLIKIEPEQQQSLERTLLCTHQTLNKPVLLILLFVSRARFLYNSVFTPQLLNFFLVLNRSISSKINYTNIIKLFKHINNKFKLKEEKKVGVLIMNDTKSNAVTIS